MIDNNMFLEPNSFRHVFNVTISPTELAKDYDRLRELLDNAGYADSVVIGPEVNHVGDGNIGEKYAETFLRSQKNVVDYVSWHQYYLNGREAKVEDFVNPLTFDVLPEQIKSMGRFVAASGRNVPMWLCKLKFGNLLRRNNSTSRFQAVFILFF